MITTKPETEELLDGRDWSEVRGKISRPNLTPTVIEWYVEEKMTYLFLRVKNIWCKVNSFISRLDFYLQASYIDRC